MEQESAGMGVKQSWASTKGAIFHGPRSLEQPFGDLRREQFEQHEQQLANGAATVVVSTTVFAPTQPFSMRCRTSIMLGLNDITCRRRPGSGTDIAASFDGTTSIPTDMLPPENLLKA